MDPNISTEDLVAQVIGRVDPGTYVTKYIVIAEGMDKDGRTAFYTCTNEKAKPWDTLGLLHYAKLRLQKDELQED